jgi:hypothetical protein
MIVYGIATERIAGLEPFIIKPLGLGEFPPIFRKKDDAITYINNLKEQGRLEAKKMVVTELSLVY